MRRFSFPLDPLLRVRRLEEQQRQRLVAHLERAKGDIEDELRRLQSTLDDGRDALRSAVTGRLDLSVLRSQAQVSIQVMRQANELVLRLAGLHRKVEQARNDLIEATRRRRAVELLRERRFAAWRADMEREEHGILDELAASKAFREGTAA